MTRTALFIDLPNFYGSLLKSGIEEPDILREYVRRWLDLDLLAKALPGSFLDIWVFHSPKKLGPATARMDGDLLKEYIRRIGALEGVTTREVDIPGWQQQPLTYKCGKCGHEADANPRYEKGIDSSLIVHLFDTMDSWDVAYLLSGDADFVPAVASLRRRGKIVNGAGFAAVASSALVRECHRYIDLSKDFLKEDIAAYSIFREGGLADRWLADPVLRDSDHVRRHNEQLRVQLSEKRGLKQPHYRIRLVAGGNSDLSTRRRLVEEFSAKFPDQRVENTEITFTLGPPVSVALKRRLGRFWPTLDKLDSSRLPQGTEYVRRYRYLPDEERYDTLDP